MATRLRDTAPKQEAAARDRDDAPEFELEPSSLDEMTHAEALALYRDAKANIRFSKGLQWRTVGGTIALFTLLVASVYFVRGDPMYARVVAFLTIVLSCGAIYSLSIHQSWQKTERLKVRKVVENLSNLSQEVFALKSRIEANIHRYILLAFMVVLIVMMNYVAFTLLQRFFVKG